MVRSTHEHEVVIDILDDLMVFSYAYEGTLATNDHLGRLKALAAEVNVDIENLKAEIGPQERKHIVISVMNRLQSAIQNGTPPPEFNNTMAWANKPPVLNEQLLQRIHAEKASGLFQLVNLVIEKLGTACPPEARPFISRRQVTDTVWAILLTMPATQTGPVHVNKLGGLLHQGFLNALAAGEQPYSNPLHWKPVLEEYMGQASDELVKEEREAFITSIVRKQFLHAKELRIAIDRYFPWGALWDEPMSGKDMLKLYVGLNLSGAVTDSKFCRKDGTPPDAGVSAIKFIQQGLEKYPRATNTDQLAKYQTFFNTNSAEIQLDGNAIQNLAIMAIRYDEPLRDIEKNLKHFGIYLIKQRSRYCANTHESLSAEENAFARRNRANELEQRKITRGVLHDKSSVLSHICALTFLQMSRDPSCIGMMKKTLLNEIQTLVNQSGFDYGIESIRKSCSKLDKEKDSVSLFLSKL